MARGAQLSVCGAQLKCTGSWSREQCEVQRESRETPRALWVASNQLKEPEVHEMDPGMMMAGSKASAHMTKLTTTSDRTRRKGRHTPIFESFLYYMYFQGGRDKNWAQI